MRSEGYGSRSVCLCVCVSPLILALQAPNLLMNDNNGFSATSVRKVMWRFRYKGAILDRETGIFEDHVA